MSDSSTKSSQKLAEVFAKINMSELPAMSVHVQELLALTSGKKSANYDDLAKIILNDYSLTHKVLQFANSAYYTLGQKVSTVSMAVAVLGFDCVRDLAIGIALYEDFVQAGVETEKISTLLCRSFLAATLARRIAESRYLKVLPEEAFICGLMRNLGKMITCIYMPGFYKEIEAETKKGIAEDVAALDILEGLSFSELGREVAIFWNMTDSVIQCMDTDPEVANEDSDAGQYLHNIVDFSNRYVESLWFLRDIDDLMAKYGFTLSIDEEEAVEMLSEAAASQTFFSTISPGTQQIDYRKRLEEIERKRENKAADCPKNIEDFWKEMNLMIQGAFRLNDFFSLLLDALFQGIGFDRVFLAMLQVKGEQKALVGQMGRGDISPLQLKEIFIPLHEAEGISEILSMCKDMAFMPGKEDYFPANLRYLLKNRVIYLFPICLKKKGVALLYLDRKDEKNKLDKSQVQRVKQFRDLAQKAIQMKRKK